MQREDSFRSVRSGLVVRTRPHYDSLADPASFAKYLGGFSDEVVGKIRRENLCSRLVTGWSRRR
jgi:hypothetical protein